MRPKTENFKEAAKKLFTPIEGEGQLLVLERINSDFYL